MSNSRKVIVLPYSALVRPRVEYCVQLWTTQFKKDIDELDYVQRTVSRMVKEQKPRPVRNGVCLAWRGQDYVIAIFKYLKNSHKEGGASLFFSISEG